MSNTSPSYINMKICRRYPFPKSLPSGKGLTIASLEVTAYFQILFSTTVMQRTIHSQMQVCLSASERSDGSRFLLR